MTYIAGRSVYSLYHPHIIFNLAETNPDMKILFSLRNPVETAYSVFCRQKERGSNKTFEQMIKIDEIDDNRKNNTTCYPYGHPEKVPGMIAKGIYYPGIKLFYRLFNQDQIMVLSFQDWIKHPQETLKNILVFLELDTDYHFRRAGKIQSESKKHVPVSNRTREILTEFYRPYNEKLFDLLDWRKDTWG